MERVKQKVNQDWGKKDIRNEESAMVSMLRFDFEKIDIQLRKDVEAELTNEEIEQRMRELKKQIKKDRSVSKDYLDSFGKKKWRDLAIMDIVYSKIKYPDGKIPTSKEASEKLIEAIFGKGTDKKQE